MIDTFMEIFSIKQKSKKPFIFRSKLNFFVTTKHSDVIFSTSRPKSNYRILQHSKTNNQNQITNDHNTNEPLFHTKWRKEKKSTVNSSRVAMRKVISFTFTIRIWSKSLFFGPHFSFIRRRALSPSRKSSFPFFPENSKLRNVYLCANSANYHSASGAE